MESNDWELGTFQLPLEVVSNKIGIDWCAIFLNTDVATVRVMAAQEFFVRFLAFPDLRPHILSKGQ